MQRNISEGRPPLMTILNGPLRAVGYARVSTVEQHERGVSLLAQADRIKSHCASKGWKLLRVYSDVANGAADNRPGLNTLLEAVRKGRVQAVVVVRLDRLCRSTLHWARLQEEEFQRHDVAFVSITEGFDCTTPEGRAHATILMAFAQLERERIRQRITEALAYKKSQGAVYGRIPYGFSRRQGRLVPVPKTLAVVRQMFAWKQEGASLREIARRLTKRSLPSPRGLATWNPETVKIILKNEPLYRKVM